MANDFLDYIDGFGHRVFDTPLPESQSLSIEGNPCSIAIDRSLPLAEQRVRLAHELGHCQRGAFYHEGSPQQTVGRCEHRAKAWSYMMLTPPCAIYYSIRSGCHEVWQMAEAFGVTDKFMTEALEYYRDKHGIDYNVFIREMMGD